MDGYAVTEEGLQTGAEPTTRLVENNSVAQCELDSFGVGEDVEVVGGHQS